MKSGWETKTLGDVCDFISRGISPVYVETKGLCVLNQKCVRDHKIDYSVARLHNDKIKKVVEEKIVKVGDVLVNSTGTGTLGRVAQILEEPATKTTVDGHVSIVRPKLKKFFDPFFGYAMIAIEDQIAQMGEGCGGQTELARTTLREKFEISYPTALSEQKRIVSILDKAFAAIATAKENAERNSKNLQALFESFLTIKFSNHNDSWRESTLGEIYDVRDGTHDSPRYYETGYPLITSKNLKRNVISFEGANLIREEDYIKINQRSMVDKGDVLFAMIGTIGNPTVVKIKPNFAIKNVALFKVPKDQSGEYLKHYLASKEVILKMANDAKGTTQKFVGLGYLRSFPMRIPPLERQIELVRKFNDLSEEISLLEKTIERKSKDLDELKKSIFKEAFVGGLDGARS